jgi:hypothetical protein
MPARKLQTDALCVIQLYYLYADDLGRIQRSPLVDIFPRCMWKRNRKSKRNVYVLRCAYLHDPMNL